MRLPGEIDAADAASCITQGGSEGDEAGKEAAVGEDALAWGNGSAIRC